MAAQIEPFNGPRVGRIFYFILFYLRKSMGLECPECVMGSPNIIPHSCNFSFPLHFSPEETHPSPNHFRPTSDARLWTVAGGLDAPHAHARMPFQPKVAKNLSTHRPVVTAAEPVPSIVPICTGFRGGIPRATAGADIAKETSESNTSLNGGTRVILFANFFPGLRAHIARVVKLQKTSSRDGKTQSG